LIPQITEATGVFELYFEYASPAGLGVPTLYGSTTAYDLIAEGGVMVLGTFRRMVLASLITVRSGAALQYFRVFANTPILVDVRANLTVRIDSGGAAGIDYKDPEKGYSLCFNSVILDQYV
jgi:hypothetical protein